MTDLLPYALAVAVLGIVGACVWLAVKPVEPAVSWAAEPEPTPRQWNEGGAQAADG